MLLVIIDAYSKWIETFIMKSSTCEATIEKLRECFAQHGIPDLIVSDNAADFKREEFANFTRRNGIAHTFMAPFHPSRNGVAERAVQTVKNGINRPAGDTIHIKLHRFLLQYRITHKPLLDKAQLSCLTTAS